MLIGKIHKKLDGDKKWWYWRQVAYLIDGELETKIVGDWSEDKVNEETLDLCRILDEELKIYSRKGLDNANSTTVD